MKSKLFEVSGFTDEAFDTSCVYSMGERIDG